MGRKAVLLLLGQRTLSLMASFLSLWGLLHMGRVSQTTVREGILERDCVETTR